MSLRSLTVDSTTADRGKIAANDFSDQTLQLTSKLLQGTAEYEGNPEYYTVWNQRRRILVKILSGDPASTQERLNKELEFQLPLLKKYPKCYWLWNHRMWLLTQAGNRLDKAQIKRCWEQELALDSMMLTRDNRNFHGWNYRRRIVNELHGLEQAVQEQDENSPPASDGKTITAERQRLCEDEFAYTRKMIRSSLSNFSAWHQRAMLIPRIVELRNASEEDRRVFFDNELSYIREAVLTDPWNQSLWFFHDYMMGVLLDHQASPSPKVADDKVPPAAWIEFTNYDREQYLAHEIGEIKEVLEDTDDCKWIYQSLLRLAEAYLDIDAGNQGAVFTTKDLKHWLGKLRAIDPLRDGRWQDWSVKLGLE